MAFDQRLYRLHLARARQRIDQLVVCPGCGREVTFHGGATEHCPYCGASLQQTSAMSRSPRAGTDGIEADRLNLQGGVIVFNPSAHPRGAAGSGMGGKFIQSGATGVGVQRVQQKVGGTTVDGKYGPKTEARIRAFQQSHGLKVDGVVGRQTAAALLGGPSQSPGALTPAQAKILGLTATKGTKAKQSPPPVKSAAQLTKSLYGSVPIDPHLYRLHLARERQRLALDAPIQPIGGKVKCPECGTEFEPDVQDVMGNPYNFSQCPHGHTVSLNLAFTNIVFDPSKHPRLRGKFTVAGKSNSAGGGVVLQPNARIRKNSGYKRIVVERGFGGPSGPSKVLHAYHGTDREIQGPGGGTHKLVSGSEQEVAAHLAEIADAWDRDIPSPAGPAQRRKAPIDQEIDRVYGKLGDMEAGQTYNHPNGNSVRVGVQTYHTYAHVTPGLKGQRRAVEYFGRRNAARAVVRGHRRSEIQ